MTPCTAGTAIALRTCGAALLVATVATNASAQAGPEALRASVVQVVVLDGTGNARRVRSGFAVPDAGHVATAAHGVANSNAATSLGSRGNPRGRTPNAIRGRRAHRFGRGGNLAGGTRWRPRRARSRANRGGRNGGATGRLVRRTRGGGAGEPYTSCHDCRIGRAAGGHRRHRGGDGSAAPFPRTRKRPATGGASRTGAKHAQEEAERGQAPPPTVPDCLLTSETASGQRRCWT